MSHNARWVVMIGLLLGLATASGGCLLLAGAGAGAGAFAYVKGKATETVKANPPAVATATEGAFKALEITQTSKESSPLSATLKGKTADGTDVTVSVTTEGSDVSKVEVRFGLFGDKDKSQRLMDEIKKRL